jgi:predicted O-linked N-acetylglucosamine transferase (SPINDLY family)
MVWRLCLNFEHCFTQDFYVNEVKNIILDIYLKKMRHKYKKFINSLIKAKQSSMVNASPKLSNLQKAIEFHQVGLLSQAETIYRELLKFDQRNGDALHLLGVIAYQTGKYHIAIELIGQAIGINPKIASYHSNLALALHELKQFDDAVASYDNSITLNSDYAEAFYNKGNALYALNKLDDAVKSYCKAIEIKNDFAEAYSNLGLTLQGLKNLETAIANYDKAITIKPDYVEAYSNRGIAFQELKLFEAALASYDKAISLKPDLAEVYCNRGIALQELKQFGASLESYEKAISLKPDLAEAYTNRGNVLKELNQLDAAVDSYDKAIALKSDSDQAYFNRGNALKELMRFDSAVASYDKAIILKPDFADAYCNRGLALHALKQFGLAVANYDIAIALKPNFAVAYSNRGLALQELNQLDYALASYDKAIELKPDYVEAYSNKGNVLLKMKHLAAAVVCYDKAIFLKPDLAEAYSNKGHALQELKQLDSAVSSYDMAITLKPSLEYLFGMRQHAKMRMCDWQDYYDNVLELDQRIKNNERASPSIPVLALHSSLSIQRIVSEIWCADKHPPNHSLGEIPKMAGHQKIRIGYYSAEFRIHPVSILTVGMFEQHDKSHFELFAFSFGPDTKDAIRIRVENAFDRFIDVRAKTDEEVALLSRELGIDIAIDLSGLTQDGRPGIFSFRAAPIQLSYIGYLGTIGANYYDYLIADQTIIPKHSQVYYSEKIVYLPSYQANDHKQELPQNEITRSELNLPSKGFVYCCFNANYKITPPTFDSWMNILSSVQESVLLLYADNQSVVKNLKLEAEKRGVNPERLIFGGMLNRSSYLARYRSADLFLDTLPYNAGATASDALWAGLPVLTCLGESFASRVAASLLNAIKLQELVTQTQAEYEALAIELATNPAKLKAIKDKLVHNRFKTLLFDTPRFTKHLETAYIMMYERYRNDLPPDNIYIQDS